MAAAAESGSNRGSVLGAWSRGGWRRRAPARSGSLAPRREANVSLPFSPIGGIRAGVAATQWCLPHRAVDGQPLPIDPDHGVVLEQPLPPDLVEHPRLDPLLK